jgi:hypothetical protein
MKEVTEIVLVICFMLNYHRMLCYDVGCNAQNSTSHPFRVRFYISVSFPGSDNKDALADTWTLKHK